MYSNSTRLAHQCLPGYKAPHEAQHECDMRCTVHTQEEELGISQKWNQPPTTSQGTPTSRHSTPTSTIKTQGTMLARKCMHSQLQSEDRGQHHSSEPWTALEGLVDRHLYTLSDYCRCMSVDIVSHVCPHSVADSVLEGVLCDVCSEMAGACDSLATCLFSLEFQPSPVSSWDRKV